jgi:hypothetical protein
MKNNVNLHLQVSCVIRVDFPLQLEGILKGLAGLKRQSKGRPSPCILRLSTFPFDMYLSLLQEHYMLLM